MSVCVRRAGGKRRRERRRRRGGEKGWGVEEAERARGQCIDQRQDEASRERERERGVRSVNADSVSPRVLGLGLDSA